MIEIRRSPSGARVAGRAILKKLSVMGVVLFMTGLAVSWSAFECTVDMALRAGNIDVSSR